MAKSKGAKTKKQEVALPSNGTAKTNSEEESVLQGPIFKGGVKHFSPVDLMRFELTQAKVVDSQKDIRLAQSDMDQLKLNFERAAKMLQDRHATALVSLRQNEKALMILRKDIEKVYDVDCNKITYNDTSGEIMIPPEGPPVEAQN